MYGLQGTAYKNDKQVVEQHYLLDYDDNERVEVKIWEIKGSNLKANERMWKRVRDFRCEKYRLLRGSENQEWTNWIEGV